MTSLKKCIDNAGGVPAVSATCEVSPRALYKWLSADSLPRTEYTGETDYSKRIAALAAQNGKPFDAIWLLAEAHPGKATKTAA